MVWQTGVMAGKINIAPATFGHFLLILYNYHILKMDDLVPSGIFPDVVRRVCATGYNPVGIQDKLHALRVGFLHQKLQAGAAAVFGAEKLKPMVVIAQLDTGAFRL